VDTDAAFRVPYSAPEMEEIKKRAMAYLDKVAEGVRSMGATVECTVGVGKPSDQILRLADEIQADLIALSTHGRSGFSQLAFGSVTSNNPKGRVPRACPWVNVAVVI